MKQLVKHLLETNLDEILSKSLLNCHVKGLHSIMLLDCPGKTIRLYVCAPNNDMHKNYPENMSNGMSLAFHPHHCDLTLYCTKGNFLNWEAEEAEDYSSMCLGKYKYHSHIKEGQMNFEYLGMGYLRTREYRRIFEGDTVFMKANEIHSVACNVGEYTAWLVFEGKEDSTYSSYCWTNSDPNEQKHDNLYQKMSKDTLLELLAHANLL